jgi:hypothetical protein
MSEGALADGPREVPAIVAAKTKAKTKANFLSSLQRFQLVSCTACSQQSQ